MKRIAFAVVVGSLAVAAAFATTSSVGEAPSVPPSKYVVVYDIGSADAARAAIARAGGTIERDNAAVGVATVTTTNGTFAEQVQAVAAVQGIARDRVIGATANAGPVRPPRQAVETEGRHSAEAPVVVPPPVIPRGVPAVDPEPLAELQWDMQAIGATATGSYPIQPGRPEVLVGVMDTGVDGSHPDIAPNFSFALSRNFTTEIPVDADGNQVDGPCENVGCVDPADVDDNGHGTHVASIIASPNSESRASRRTSRS